MIKKLMTLVMNPYAFFDKFKKNVKVLVVYWRGG